MSYAESPLVMKPKTPTLDRPQSGLRFVPMPWSPTRGEAKNASEQAVADILTTLGISWNYEDSFLPLGYNEERVLGICPDYHIPAGDGWREQYVEVTTAKQITKKRRKLRRAARLYSTPITLITKSLLEQIQVDPTILLELLAPAV